MVGVVGLAGKGVWAVERLDEAERADKAGKDDVREIRGELVAQPGPIDYVIFSVAFFIPCVTSTAFRAVGFRDMGNRAHHQHHGQRLPQKAQGSGSHACCPA